MQTPPGDRLLRATEIMNFLNINRATADRLMTDGSLPVYRFGSGRGQRAMVRVALRDLIAWRESQKTPAVSVA